MSTSKVDFSDDYVDIDDLLKTYHRRKSTILFLIAAITFIFYGTISGYSALQYTTAKAESLYTTTVEFAAVTAKSNHCVSEPTDPVCVKAKQITENPDKAVEDGLIVKPGTQLEAKAYNFHTDPITQLIAIILTQPFILRLQ